MNEVAKWWAEKRPGRTRFNERDAEIVTALMEGETSPQVALRYGISSSRVRQIWRNFQPYRRLYEGDMGNG